VNNVHTVIGGMGNDTLVGGAGDDTLVGGPGNDSINGGGGDDTIVWNEGDGVDTLAGGSGTDTFQILGSDSVGDTITAATSGADVTVTRTAPSGFALTAGPSQGIEKVAVLTRGGGDQVNVQSVPTGATLVVSTGEGDDAVTLDSNGATAGGTVNGILGSVQVDGGNGTNTLAIVNADSTATTAAAITPTQVGAGNGNSLFGSGGTLTYAGIATLNVTFGSGNDSATVTPSASTAYVLAGGSQPNADTLNVLQSGVNGPSVSGSADNGQFTSSNRQPVTYTAFEAILLDGVSPNGILQFASPTYAVDESASAATITISRTQASQGAVSVVIGTTDGTAKAPADYEPLLTRVDFGPGETSKTVQIAIKADTLNEPSETVNLSLGTPHGGATLGSQTSAVLTIANVAPTQSCSPRPQVVTQPVAGGGKLQVHIEATQLNTGQNNRVSELRFGQLANARVTLNGQTVSDNQTVTLPANMFGADFTVERVTPGQATTVPFTVVDGCGEWKTFVGGGTGASF
jgi:hypothetical protein